jgi:mannosyltransferase
MLNKWLHLNEKERNGLVFFQYLKRPTVLFGLVLLLGTVLRFYDLGAESYWIDEMSTVMEGQQSIQQLFTSGRLDQPLAYYVPFHFWEQIFGTAEAYTRAFSALAGVGSIVLIYLLGRELFGETVGLFAAFLMAISEFQIFFSQATRFYSFYEFFAILSFMFFGLALKNNNKACFIAYVVASIFLVYSHTYGVFILAAQNLFFVLRWKKHSRMIVIWLACQAIIVLAFFPYFFPLFFGEKGVRGAIDLNIGGLSTPSLLDPLRSIYHFVLSARRERNWQIMIVNYFVAGALLVTGTWIYVLRQGKNETLKKVRGMWREMGEETPDMMSKILLLGCWLFCPILLPFIASFVIGPMYEDHYMISAAPALYLLLAFAVFSIRKVVPVVISAAVLLVMIAPSLGVYYVTDIHEQWDEAAKYVEENSMPGDVIVFAPNQGIGTQQKTFDWYYQGDLRGCGLGSDLKDRDAILSVLQQCVYGHDRFWVVMRINSGEATSDRYEEFFLGPDQTSLRLVGERQFVGGIFIYLFEMKND